MSNLNVHYRNFAQLPLTDFDKLNHSVYVLDLDWTYLFVNRFVARNLGDRGLDLVGKNMWECFSKLATNITFQQIRDYMDRRIPISVVTTSPITSQRLSITGHPLEDCHFFTSVVLPDRDYLITELRSALKRMTGRCG